MESKTALILRIRKRQLEFLVYIMRKECLKILAFTENIIDIFQEEASGFLTADQLD